MLSHVEITKPAQLACTAHALTTQTEEVMGLLVGLWVENAVLITHVFIVKRQNNTRQKDRVEIAPEELSRATIYAEKLAKEEKRDFKVVGWFHSHPHISVLPSHVDARTQGEYQYYMDSRFVGIIVSAFDENPNDVSGSIKMIAFQSERSSTQDAWKYKLMKIKLINTYTRSHIAFKDSLATIVESLKKIALEEKSLREEVLNEAKGQCLKQAFVDKVYQKCLILLIENGCLPLYTLLKDRKMSLDETKSRLKFLLESLKSRGKPEGNARHN